MTVKHQVALNAVETIRAKLEFEREAGACGVKVQAYHTDNGVFQANDFLQELMKEKKDISFSGVGAAHQNGTAERAIRTIVDMA